MGKNIRAFDVSLALAVFLGAASGNQSFADAGATHSSLFDTVSNRYTAVTLGTSFPYYSQAERIQTITDIVKSIEADYSLLLYKQNTLGIDIAKIGTDAIAVEQNIADTTVVADQALGNMQFLDRMRKIAATLQDSHFQLDGTEPCAPVSLGFAVSNIGGKYLVSSLRPKYLASDTLKFNFTAQVAVGDELVSIDGKDPAAAAQELKPFLPGSSDQFRINMAVFGITSRDYSLPTQATSAVVLRRAGTTVNLNLPWGAPLVTRTDEATYLKNIGLSSELQNLDLNVGSVFDEGWRTKIAGLKNELDLADISDPTSTQVVLGTLDTPQGSVGYMQLRSFEITGLVPVQGTTPQSTVRKPQAKNSITAGFFADVMGATKQPAQTATAPTGPIKFNDLVDSVIASFKAKSMPLILDLRYNLGGSVGEAMQVVGDLAPTNGSIAPTTQMFRITNLSWSTIDAIVAAGIQDPTKMDPAAVQIAAVFTDAASKGDSYSEIMPAGPLVSSKTVGGYDQKVVALVSPQCISACDATVLMLKASGRATLVGEPANGTGAGFLSTFTVPDFTDTNHIVTAHLPNSLFGRPLKAGESGATISVESVEAENHPTQPDVSIQATWNDVLNGNADLINTALTEATKK